MKKTEFEYKIMDEGILQNIEQLNVLGREGWEIVAIHTNKIIFKRIHEETSAEKEAKDAKNFGMT